ncbi:MAG: DUF4349 domain-containing protein [Gaiellaceae bacterium]
MRSPEPIAPDRLEELLCGALPEAEREARFQGLVRELRGDAPPAPEALRGRVQALGGELPRRRPAFGRRRLTLVLAPAILVAVLAAAVVLGDGRTSEGTPPGPAALERGVPPATGLTRDLGAKAAAGESSAQYEADARLPELGDGRARDVDMSIELRLRDADDLSDAASEAMRVTRELGGYVASSDLGTRGAEGQAKLALRVPVGRLEDAVFRLSQLGTITEQQVAIEDLQGRLDSRSRRIEGLRREIRIAELRLASGTLDADERLRLEIRLERLRDSLDRLRGERRRLRREAATAELTLTLHTREAPAAAEDESGVGAAARDGLDFLARAGTVALFAGIVLSPLLLLAAVVLLALRGRSRRIEARLLEQPRPSAPARQASEPR